jgi:predicted acetyltransferase
MSMDEIRLRAGTAEDWDAISDLLGFVFHETMTAEERASEGSVFEPERSIVAVDGEVVVGHAAAYTRELTVPGAIVPAAHVSLVGVMPTHRRRGLLSQMMKRQLGEIAEAGREPLAVLWASETGIYPRFGYGSAGRVLRIDAMTREVGPPAQPTEGYEGKLRLVKPLEAIGDFAKVYEQLRGGRVGWSNRDERWWKFVLEDLESQRNGATERYGVVHDTPHGPTGYAIWRSKNSWDQHGPNDQTQIREVIAADPQTYAALWRFLLTLDLSRSARAGYLAVDEPLLHLVGEPRRLGITVSDGLWVRVIDVPAALAARRYLAPIDLVFEVSDPLLPGNTGRWRLTGGPAGATCTPTGDPADLGCTVLELGAAYLGGPSLGALAAAGNVRELTAGTLAPASAAFGWRRQPQAIEVF